MQPDAAAPTRRPFASLLPLATGATVLFAMEMGGLIGSSIVRPNAADPSALLLHYFMLLVHVVMYIAARVVFLRWVLVAYRNLDAFETAGLETTAGWAVGWFFVPIVNLYRPFMIFHEIWKASTPGVDSRDEIAWQRVPSSPLIGWWWATLLLDLFLPRMIDKVLTHGMTDLASAILSAVLGSATAVLTIVVILRISRRQEAKAKALAPKLPSYL